MQHIVQEVFQQKLFSELLKPLSFDFVLLYNPLVKRARFVRASKQIQVPVLSKFVPHLVG